MALTLVLPQEPQPRVREGSRWKLYRSPIALQCSNSDNTRHNRR